TPRSEAYFVFPLAQGTPGKQCGLAATGVYQPSLRSPWLAAQDAGKFLASRNWRQPVFLAWGAAGAWCRIPGGEIMHAPAPEVAVADSLGAGDVFNAGIIDALLRKSSPEQSLHHAVRLAAAKCTRPGLVI
ncbi:carbohydrate kinase family protein, partial [Thiolapillus sp.]